MPKVSVIIPVYNCSTFVTDALNSVLRQSYSDYEIIVVDDGSTDDLIEKLAFFFDKIKYIHQENKGLSCARNTGIKNSKGDYIAFLDADDMWMPEKLQEQVPVFDLDPNIGIVHSDINKFTEMGGYIPSLRKNFIDSQISLHSGYIFDRFFTREIFISCPTVIVRRECFDKVGIFDENLARLGFEDSDMWLRILRFYEARYIHKPLAIYRVRQDSMSKNRKKMVQAHRYVITKLSNQYDLPQTLTNKAINAIRKEWGLGHYAFAKYARNTVKLIRSKFRSGGMV